MGLLRSFAAVGSALLLFGNAAQAADATSASTASLSPKFNRYIVEFSDEAVAKFRKRDGTTVSFLPDLALHSPHSPHLTTSYHSYNTFN